MYEDDRDYRTMKKTFRARVLTWVTVACLLPIVALAGVYVANMAEQVSIDYRTAESTEVHKVVGQPYIHLGDRVPVTSVKLGQTFYVHNNYVKIETCHVFVSNVFWGKSGVMNVAHHDSMFVNWFFAGTYEADELFVARKDLPPGDYKIVKKTISFCNGKEHYTLNFSVPVTFSP